MFEMWPCKKGFCAAFSGIFWMKKRSILRKARLDLIQPVADLKFPAKVVQGQLTKTIPNNPSLFNIEAYSFNSCIRLIPDKARTRECRNGPIDLPLSRQFMNDLNGSRTPLDIGKIRGSQIVKSFTRLKWGIRQKRAKTFCSNEFPNEATFPSLWLHRTRLVRRK